MQFQETVRTSHSFQCWHISCGGSRWTFRIWQLYSARVRYKMLPPWKPKLLQSPSVCAAVNAVPRDSENQLQLSVLAASVWPQSLDVWNLAARLCQSEIHSVAPLRTKAFAECECLCSSECSSKGQREPATAFSAGTFRDGAIAGCFKFGRLALRDRDTQCCNLRKLSKCRAQVSVRQLMQFL